MLNIWLQIEGLSGLMNVIQTNKSAQLTEESRLNAEAFIIPVKYVSSHGSKST